MGERWKGTEFEFDPSGKLIIRDRELARQIAEQIEAHGTLELYLDPSSLPLKRCPPPPDIMCGCEVKFVNPSVNPGVKPGINPNIKPNINPGINPRKVT